MQARKLILQDGELENGSELVEKGAEVRFREGAGDLTDEEFYAGRVGG